MKKTILHYLIICFPALFFLLNPAKFPSDDGFFYPQIAYHIVNGNGSYFNDLYLTNGYHPLWMLICILTELVNPFYKQVVIYLLWGIQVLLIIFSFKNLEIFFEKNLIGKIISFTIISILFFSLGTLYLIEAHLNLFCITLLLNLLAKKEKNDWLTGLVFSLCFLSRLDNLFPLILLGFYYLLDRRFNLLSITNSGIVVLGLCGIYILSNYFWFGSFVPISGRVKSSFPTVHPTIFVSLIGKFFLISTILTFAVWLYLKNIPFRKLKLYLAAGAIIQMVYNFLFQSQIGQWYYVIQMLVLALVFGDLIYLVFKNKKLDTKLIWISLIGCTLTSSAIAYNKLKNNFSVQSAFSSNSKVSNSPMDGIKHFAREMRSSLPKDTRIFTYDFPGKFAFYSNLSIIPADGLVGNKDYFDELTRLKFIDFLKNNEIEYIVLPSHFNKLGQHNFIALNVEAKRFSNRYYIKNTLTKKITDSIELNKFRKVRSYVNPIKTWQNGYDSVTLYQIRN